MKRNTPNSSIDLYILKKEKTPQQIIEDVQSKAAHFENSYENKNVQIIELSSDLTNYNQKEYDKKLDDTWESLSRGIDLLFEKDVSHVNCQKLYQNAEYYCRFQNPKLLFNKLLPKFDTIIDNFIPLIVNQNIEFNGISELLKTMEVKLIFLMKILSYLDRSYIYPKRIDGYSSICDLFYFLFRQKLKLNTDNLDYLLEKLKLEISIFRCEQNEPIDKLKTVIDFLERVGLYDEYVEPLICEQAKDYYSAISHKLSLPQFIEWLDISYEREHELTKAGIKLSTNKLIMMIINKVCLEENSEMIFGNDFQIILEKRNKELIKTLYKLFDNDNVRQIFIKNIGLYFTKYSKKLLEKDDINQIISEYWNSIQFIKDAFDSQKVYETVKESFDQSFLPKYDHLAKLLAYHFDKSGAIKEKEIEFLKICRSKSTFESTYSYLLTKRIFSGIQIDIQREKEIIKEFKFIAGSEYTARLKTIIKDYINSKSIDCSIPNFDAVILSLEVFPNNTFNDEVKYPNDINQNMINYSNLFLKNNKRKVIHWSAKLTTVYGTINNIQIIMNGFQAIIILSLQNSKKTFEEIKEETNIEQETLKDYLTVMKSKKSYNIIINENDYYYINANFTTESNPFTLPSVEGTNSEKEKSYLESNIEYIQENELKCNIIILFKLFKELTLTELYNKVIKKLKFELTTIRFSNCIKQLESSGFIEQSAEKTYRYVP